jgi:3-hydroxyisobutyrate dehydrogenase-like beta-hydroxyacid dehydrogenase
MTTLNATESIAFLGLGALGAPIASNLLQSGVPLTVRNHTASKAQPLLQLGAASAASPIAAITRGPAALSAAAVQK